MTAKNKLTLVLGLFLTGLIVPSVNATTENFEAYDALSSPCLPTPVSPSLSGPHHCTGSNGVIFSAGSVSVEDPQVVNNGAIGSKAFVVRGNAYEPSFITHRDLCQAPFTFKVKFPNSTDNALLIELSATITADYDGDHGAPDSYNEITIQANLNLADIFITTYVVINGVSTTYQSTPPINIASFSPSTIYQFTITCPVNNNSGLVVLTLDSTLQTTDVFIPSNTGTTFYPSCNYNVGAYFVGGVDNYIDDIVFSSTIDNTCFPHYEPLISSSSSSSSSFTLGPSGCNTNGTDEDNFIIINKTYIANQLCTSTKGLNWLLGLWLVCLVAIVAGAVITGSPLVIGIAALVGIGIAVGFGLFPVWFLLLIIFLVIILGSVFLGGGNNGEE